MGMAAAGRLTPEAVFRIINARYDRMHPDEARRAHGRRFVEIVERNREWYLRCEFLHRDSAWPLEWWK
jgi:hypothetical protein